VSPVLLVIVIRTLVGADIYHRLLCGVLCEVGSRCRQILAKGKQLGLRTAVPLGLDVRSGLKDSPC
jgi:hypothetical protein